MEQTKMTRVEKIQVGIMVAQFGMLLITIASLFIVLRSNDDQLQVFTDQLRLNFFADYTKRYQNISINLPANICDADFDFSKLDEEKRNNTYKYLRAYFDLCSEEFDLKQGGYIDEGVWNIWVEAIRFLVTKKAFKESWERVQKDRFYDARYVAFINKLITNDLK